MMKKLGNNFVNSETIDDDETIFFKIGFAIKIEDFRLSHSSSTKLVGQKVDSGGLYRLLQCTSKGDKAGVIQELDKGVEPNGADYDRRPALHLAACEGWIEVVDLLLEKGADVNSLDHWGRTVSFKFHVILSSMNIFLGVVINLWVLNC
ncbi:hypothetical protein ES332_A06G109400v1 [Gossypium tomentosum]|uniref:Uncharacterized protein n=1 Tax=Gossypium tomentosum TaxID=34277 RepID=A0A5D2Q295_GOSTO|nr:hypothetical protein ES332_A06G109400v1 [Gossypium tomentosum]